MNREEDLWVDSLRTTCFSCITWNCKNGLLLLDRSYGPVRTCVPYRPSAPCLGQDSSLHSLRDARNAEGGEKLYLKDMANMYRQQWENVSGSES